jgi:hypothetical protein
VIKGYKVKQINKKIQKKLDIIFKKAPYKDFISTSLVSIYGPNTVGEDIFNFENEYNYKVVAVYPIGVCTNINIRNKYDLSENDLLFSVVIFDNVILSVKRSVFFVTLSYDEEKYKNKFRLLDKEREELSEGDFNSIFINPDVNS